MTRSIDEAPTGSMFGGKDKSKGMFGSILSSAKKALLLNIDADKTDLLDNFRYLQPVYKIMITVPTGDTETIPYRYIVADTSKVAGNISNKSDSPLIGLWVDQSDLAEPDKAILLLESEMIRKGVLSEQNIINMERYGLRHWVDIWIGYRPITSTFASLLSVLEGSGISKTLLGLNTVVNNILGKIPLTYPDAFFFGNDSHVFSGPIVSVRRTITGNGDRTQVVAFSPMILMKGMKATNVKYTTVTPLVKVIKQIASDIKMIPDLTNRGVSEELNQDGKFYLGQFPHYMFCNEDGGLRVDPVVGDDPRSTDEGGESKGVSWTVKQQFHTYNISDPNAIHDKMKGTGDVKIKEGEQLGNLRTDIVGNTDLFQLLFTILVDPSLHGLRGLYASIKFNHAENPMMAMTEGKGHPGIRVQYGYQFEIEDIQRRVKEKAFSKNFLQSATLGRDARELNIGMEYGTSYNSREFLFRMKDVDGTAPILKRAKFPLDPLFLEKIQNVILQSQRDARSLLNNPSLEESGSIADGLLFEFLLRDIAVHGLTDMPTPMWIWTEGQKVIEEGWEEIFASIMRSSYFAGMAGSVYMIGSPSMKPERVLTIIDSRSSPLDTISSKLMKDTFNRNKLPTDSLISASLGRDRSKTPIGMTLREPDKNFYIWKVRHYIGKSTGYISKVYFLEERSRAWQQQSGDIGKTIQSALADIHNTVRSL